MFTSFDVVSRDTESEVVVRTWGEGVVVVEAVVNGVDIGVVARVGIVPVQGRVTNPTTSCRLVTTPTISIKEDGSISSGISSSLFSWRKGIKDKLDDSLNI